MAKFENDCGISSWNCHVIPYVKNARKDESLVLEVGKYEYNLSALLIMDHHWTHLLPDVEMTLKNLDIALKLIPKKATDLFSVLDVALNRPYKAHLNMDLVAEEYVKQIKDGISPLSIKG